MLQLRNDLTFFLMVTVDYVDMRFEDKKMHSNHLLLKVDIFFCDLWESSMLEQQKKKRFALFLTKCDSEFVKKVNGGYFNIFVSTCGEDGEQWDLFRVVDSFSWWEFKKKNSREDRYVMIRPELVVKSIVDEFDCGWVRSWMSSIVDKFDRGWVRDLPWLSLGSVVAELKVVAVEFQRVDELGIQLQFHCLENP